MRKISLFTILFLSFIVLMGCSNALKVPANYETTKENWQKQINLDSNQWLKGVDSWFLTGKPNEIETNGQKTGASLSTIPVPSFNEVHVTGHFQVQIVGGEPSYNVFVFGPKEEREQISVKVINNRLYVQQISDSDMLVPLRGVVVRFGIPHLTHLSNTGSATVLGRTIGPDPITIKNTGGGSIFLDGRINVRDIAEFGAGTITLIDTKTPMLNINLQGNGNVNLRGRIGVKTIKHYGNGSINIIGADSRSLRIYAAGSGLTAVSGYVKLKEITACNHSRVYVNCVHSDSISIVEWDNAHVGIAGSTNQLNVTLANIACFQGEYLYSDQAYVKTKNNSHAEVFVDKKLFAGANDMSSIYYFGPATMSSTFTGSRSRILALGAAYRAQPILACQARANIVASPKNGFK